jgi:protoporphyrinogen IX oxidase
MDFQYIKALHIIFVVCWFAGLFYMPRLFIYFVEARNNDALIAEALQKQFLIMQKRLWYGITWPSMIATYIFGFWMIFLNPNYLQQPWMMLKLAFIFGLTLYHLQCGLIRKQQQAGIIKYSSFLLRVFNEIATVILVAVVFIVVLKDTLNWLYGLLGLAIFIALLMIAINVYRKLRKKNEPIKTDILTPEKENSTLRPLQG